MSGKTLNVHFELYALRSGRWTMEACFADEEEARETAQRSSRSVQVQGVRLVREVHVPGVDTPIVTTLLDTTATERSGDFRLRNLAPTATEMPPRPSLLGEDRRGRRATVPAEATAAATGGSHRGRAVLFVVACVLIAGSVLRLASLH